MVYYNLHTAADIANRVWAFIEKPVSSIDFVYSNDSREKVALISLRNKGKLSDSPYGSLYNEVNKVEQPLTVIHINKVYVHAAYYHQGIMTSMMAHFILKILTSENFKDKDIEIQLVNSACLSPNLIEQAKKVYDKILKFKKGSSNKCYQIFWANNRREDITYYTQLLQNKGHLIYEKTPKDLTSELKEAKTEIKSLEDDVDYYEYETFLEFTKRKFSKFVHRWFWQWF